MVLFANLLSILAAPCCYLEGIGQLDQGLHTACRLCHEQKTVTWALQQLLSSSLGFTKVSDNWPRRLDGVLSTGLVQSLTR